MPDAQIFQEEFVSPPMAGRRPWRLRNRAEDNGIAIPFECRSGICGQCKARLIEGSVHMDVEDALTARDRVQGLILACQARPIGDIQVDA